MTDKVFTPMGARNYAKEKRANRDFYVTDPKATIELLKREIFYPEVLEPCCVDKDTEYFNGTAWVRISEYKMGDKVLTYNPEIDQAILEEPRAYIQSKSDDVYEFNSHLLSMRLTGNHTVCYRGYRKQWRTLPMTEIARRHMSSKRGFRYHIPVSWNTSGSLHIDEWVLRLAVACSADGKLKPHANGKTSLCLFRVKKERKKQRILWLLDNAKVEYRYTSGNPAYLNLSFTAPIPDKLFPVEWFNLDEQSKRVIIDEIRYWDGNVGRHGDVHYFSKTKWNVDFVQFLVHSLGMATNIYSYNRRGTEYDLCILNRSGITMLVSDLHKGESLTHSNNPENVYCFTTSTHFWVARRNNQIFITGNSGDGAMAKIIEDAGYKVTASDICPVGTVGERKDFMDYWYWHGDIITNPPYQRAQEFVEHALDITSPDAKVAMFLRLLFLESKKRRELFDKFPPKCVYVFSERLRCYKDGDMKHKDKSGSAIAFAWFVWDKTYKGKTYIEWI